MPTLCTDVGALPCFSSLIATFAPWFWLAMERIVAKNRKASFQYELLEKYVAGIVLSGTEIKSLRQGHASLSDSYALFLNDELWVRGMHIPEYAFGTYLNHEPKRDRKLLLNRKELTKLQRSVKTKGYTIVPLTLFISERGYAKLRIALARGKQAHDKREAIKERDANRELQRAKQHRYR